MESYLVQVFLGIIGDLSNIYNSIDTHTRDTTEDRGGDVLNSLADHSLQILFHSNLPHSV